MPRVYGEVSTRHVWTEAQFRNYLRGLSRGNHNSRVGFNLHVSLGRILW